jgi:hypothetical protein
MVAGIDMAVRSTPDQSMQALERLQAGRRELTHEHPIIPFKFARVA